MNNNLPYYLLHILIFAVSIYIPFFLSSILITKNLLFISLIKWNQIEILDHSETKKH